MSHTAMTLLAGLALLFMVRLTIRDAARATLLFLLLWLIVSVGNLLVGVLYAGYGWGEEAVIALVVFGLPAALALGAARVGVKPRD